MANVTIIAPAVQVQTLGAGGQQTQNATQTGVPFTPPLSPGALVAGLITGRDSNGNYTLKTDQGTFALKSETPLTYNSDVLIRVDTNSGSNAAARIITVNGQSFSSFSTPVEEETDSLSPSLLARTGGQTQTQNAASVSETQPQTGARPVVVQAVTVPTPQGSTPSVIPQAPVPDGTPVTLNVSPPAQQPPQQEAPVTQYTAAAQLASPQANTPQANGAQAGVAQTGTSQVATPQPNVPQAATTQTQVLVQQGPAPQPSPLQPNTAQTNTNAPATTQSPAPAPFTIPANVAKLLPSQPQVIAQNPATQAALFPLPPAPTPNTEPAAVQKQLYAAYAQSAAAPAVVAAPATTGPVTVNANISAANPDGTLTLETTEGALTVKPEAVPATVQLGTGTPLTVTLPAGFGILGDITGEQAPTLDSLKQIVALLQQKSPAAADALLSRLPTIGTDFLSSSLLFFTALLQGNARKILGESTVDTLQDADGNDAVQKFTGQVASTAQGFQQPVDHNAAPNWQALVLPYVYQGAVQEARLYVKRDAPKKDQGGKKTASDTRFIVEVNFSDLGDLQLDGLVLPRENATMFDLIVRTQVPFLPEEKAEITQIYTNTAEMTGFKGSIGFHVSKEFPVKPLAEMHAKTMRDIIA